VSQKCCGIRATHHRVTMSRRRASDPVIVAHFHYRHEAEIALGYLESAGLPAALFMDDGGGSQIGMAFTRPGRIVVRPERRKEAIEILEAAGYEDRIVR